MPHKVYRQLWRFIFDYGVSLFLSHRIVLLLLETHSVIYHPLVVVIDNKDQCNLSTNIIISNTF